MAIVLVSLPIVNSGSENFWRPGRAVRARIFLGLTTGGAVARVGA